MQEEHCPIQGSNRSLAGGSETGNQERLKGGHLSFQTSGEDDETQPPPLESQKLSPETPLNDMPPPVERYESEAGISSLKNRPSSSQRKRGPAFDMDEQARLAHVMADPRMSFTLSKMYNSSESRGEIDDQQENPWDGIISDMFKDDSLDYVRPRPAGEALMAFLDDLDPNRHPFLQAFSNTLYL